MGSLGGGSEKIVLPQVDDPDAYGAVAFAATEASALKVAWSTNNLANDGAATGAFSNVVPPFCAHLVAVGYSKGYTYHCDALLRVPAFPYALACSGPLRANGPLVVAAVGSAQVYTSAGSLAAVDPADLLPANVASNSNTTQAVALDSGSQVQGNVQAVGGVNVVSPSAIRGEIIQGARKVQLPTFDLERYFLYVENPMEPGHSPDLLPDLPSLTTELPVLCRQSLVVHGDVQLDHGSLFVRGNLTIEGTVRGQGAIIATGVTNIKTGASLQADNSLAILSRDGVVLEGVSKDQSFFSGLIYSEGQVLARNLTILGSVVSNSPSGNGGSIQLTDCAIIACPFNTCFNIGLPYGTNYDDDQVLFWAYARKGNDGNYAFQVFARPWMTDAATGQGTWVGPGAGSATGLSQRQARDFAVGQMNSHHIQGQGPGPGAADITLVEEYLTALTHNPGSRLDQIHIDPNRFIDFGDQPRVVYMRRQD